VNLRYLAAILRVADVLEIDPERTPEIVFRQRLVHDKSQIFWLKDHRISPTIESNRIVFHARPENARIHQAIKETIDQVNTELRLCVRLKEEGRFSAGPGLPNLPHRLDLPVAVSDDIRPAGNAYEFIDGSFRPNTRKLLELLGGHQLYGGDSLVAVRELLGNAFDAVKESIALQRLRQPNPSDPKWETILGQLHVVRLTVELRADDQGAQSVWLCCEDSGIGMTKSIIEQQLLVAGAGRRHFVMELERRCATAGFSMERTGQFGIGVLCYFMLADRVLIETRRSELAGDTESKGWRFETDGVGTFGELRAIHRKEAGTSVGLRLKAFGSSREGDFDEDFEMLERDASSLKSSATYFANRLADYLRSLLVRVPCKVEVAADHETVWSLDPGWGESLSLAIKLVEKSCTDKKLGLVLGDRIEGTLYEGRLKFLAIPYALRDEESGVVAFSIFKKGGSSDSSLAYVVEGWRGCLMHGTSKEEIESFHSLPCLVLLDWVNESHGYVQVSRKGFQVRDRRYILETLTEQIGSRIADWRLTLSDISLVEKLDYPFLPWPLTPFWPHAGELKRLGGEVCFIASYQKQKHGEFLRGDQRVTLMRIDGKGMHDYSLPKKLLICRSGRSRRKMQVVFDFGAWNGADLVKRDPPRATFPPGWSAVLGCYIDSPPFSTFLNENHPILLGLQQNPDPSRIGQSLSKAIALLKKWRHYGLTPEDQVELSLLEPHFPILWIDNNRLAVLTKDKIKSYPLRKGDEYGLFDLPEEWLLRPMKSARPKRSV